MMIALLAALLALACPALAQLDPGSAIGLRVTRVDIVNRSRVADADIRDLFLLKVGEPYDLKVVQRSLGLLGEKPSIRNVIVHGERDANGLAVRVKVLPAELVRSIGFRGNHAVEDSKLASRLQTRVDRPLREVFLTRDARSLRELYGGEGFPRARVTPRIDHLTGGHWAKVVFDVDEGEPLRIVKVEPVPGLPMALERAVAIVELGVGDPASRTVLREGVDRLVKVLRGEGYPEARAERPHFEPQGKGVALVLGVRAGEPVDVRIEGMDEWAASSLRQIVRSRYGEALDSDWAQRVADELENNLRGEGYREAAVTPVFGYRYGRRRITFRVDRGPLVRVEKVEFDGNDSVPASRLETYMSLEEGGFLLRAVPFTQQALDRDLRVLREFYTSLGFLDAQVKFEGVDVDPSGHALVRLKVTEGSQYHLGRIVFDTDGGLSEKEAKDLSRLHEGDPADPGALEEARVRMLRELEKRGYPDRVVRYGTARDPGMDTVRVTYRLRGGQQVRFGHVVIAGNARTQTSVIRRELTLEEGAPWNPQEILKTRRQLYRLGFFGRVRVEPLGPVRDGGAQDVVVTVEEQDTGSVTFGLGYGTEEGVKGFGEIAQANILGSGRSLGFRTEFDRFSESYALNFREPWLFGRDNDLRLSLVKSFENRDTYNRSSIALQASLEKKVTEHVVGSLLYTLERDHLTSVTEEADSEAGTFLLSSIGPVLAWDSRDDPFNPKSGYYHTFQAEWASDLLGSQVRFERYQGSVSGYFTYGDITLALLARGGFALTLGQTAELPVNKRFYLGGRTTVRGFARDEIGPKSEDGTPLGGDVMVNLKSELRFPIYGKFAGAVFWDAGNVWNRSLEKPDYGVLRQAVGAGLRYVTPVGPLSVDIGVKLDRRSGEAPWAWHFTVGNVF